MEIQLLMRKFDGSVNVAGVHGCPVHSIERAFRALLIETEAGSRRRQALVYPASLAALLQALFSSTMRLTIAMNFARSALGKGASMRSWARSMAGMTP